MNRRERRAGHPQKVFPSTDHICDKTRMNRFKVLDHAVPPSECDGCKNNWPDCKSCNDGVTPETRYFGYKCSLCGMPWVQLEFTLRGTRHVSWRSAEELIGKEGGG